jgi:hypothetical protein
MATTVIPPYNMYAVDEEPVHAHVGLLDEAVLLVVLELDEVHVAWRLGGRPTHQVARDHAQGLDFVVVEGDAREVVHLDPLPYSLVFGVEICGVYVFWTLETEELEEPGVEEQFLGVVLPPDAHGAIGGDGEDEVLVGLVV